MSPTNIFKTEVPFNILYDTIEGKEKNPHFDKPDLSLGGLQFNFNVRATTCFNYETFMELSEASKKDLAPGYEITVSSFAMKWETKRGFTGDWSMSEPASLSCGAARIFSSCGSDSIRHVVAQISMEFRNVYPALPLEFVNAEAAKEKHADCKIILKNDGNKEVFVNKAVLAMRSSFFETLFFGDFKERDEDDVKLSNVTQVDFLEYLCWAYPLPNRHFAFKRLDTLLALADRFLNTTLVSAIENFLLEKTDKTPEEKRQMLIWADNYGMETLFGEIFNNMNKADLKSFDRVARLNFKKENHDLFVDRVLEMW